MKSNLLKGLSGPFDLSNSTTLRPIQLGRTVPLILKCSFIEVHSTSKACRQFRGLFKKPKLWGATLLVTKAQLEISADSKILIWPDVPET